MNRIPGTCWECGEIGHYSPTCPNKKPGEYIYLCSNCREEGHKASMCQKPVQMRIQPRYVPTLPKDQTAMNWGNKSAIEKPGEDATNVRFIQEYEDVRRVSTRRTIYDRSEREKEPLSLEVVEEEPDDPIQGLVGEQIQRTDSIPVPQTDPVFVLPDVSEEVLEHLAEITKQPKVKGLARSTVLVKPVLSRTARRELHYNIMQDIEKRLADVTIGELLRDSPAYRKQLMDSLKVKRRRLPSTIADVRLTEIEDWGAPEIDTEIDGCMITRVPVDGGSGVNVMLEQTASDLGYNRFEPTPKILRMANQEEVIPVGKLSKVLTRMGGLEYLLNYVIIRLPIQSLFQVLLGRPWLYKAGVLED